MPVRQDKSEPTAQSSRAAGYIFLVLAAGFAVFSPFRDWYSIGALTVAGSALLTVGSGVVYRPALTRTPDSITCRYNPFREGSHYILLIAGPAIGVAGLRQGTTAFARLAGAVMLVLVVAGALLSLRESRRCLLRISPASLAVTVPAERYALTEIPRERIVAITGETGARRNGGTGPVAQIAYRTNDSITETPETVLIGPTNAKNATWVTVEQADLLAALQAWNDADPSDPALLDRVEMLLRGGGAPAENPGAKWRGWGWAAVGLAALAGMTAYAIYQSTDRNSATPHAEGANCSVEGARMVALPKKAPDEPTVYLPLNPGWSEQPITAGAPEYSPNLRALYSNASIRDKDFTPVIQVDLVRATGTEDLATIADELFTRARTMMRVTNESIDTACGSQVYRADTYSYDPDGKGDRSGTTMITLVKGTDHRRWVAIVSIKARNQSKRDYLTQRQALVHGFHAGIP